MNGEAQDWLNYARENGDVARLSLERELYNPCLQNAQQAVEKALKAACLAMGLPLKKTHSIRELRNDLTGIAFRIELDDEDCDLLDSIYLPSKYPLGSVLPDFAPDEPLGRRCLDIAERTVAEVGKMSFPDRS